MSRAAPFKSGHMVQSNVDKTITKSITKKKKASIDGVVELKAAAKKLGLKAPGFKKSKNYKGTAYSYIPGQAWRAELMKDFSGFGRENSFGKKTFDKNTEKGDSRTDYVFGRIADYGKKNARHFFSKNVRAAKKSVPPKTTPSEYFNSEPGKRDLENLHNSTTKGEKQYQKLKKHYKNKYGPTFKVDTRNTKRSGKIHPKRKD
jgi:hypothetical protein